MKLITSNKLVRTNDKRFIISSSFLLNIVNLNQGALTSHYALSPHTLLHFCWTTFVETAVLFFPVKAGILLLFYQF